MTICKCENAFHAYGKQTLTPEMILLVQLHMTAQSPTRAPSVSCEPHDERWETWSMVILVRLAFQLTLFALVFYGSD